MNVGCSRDELQLRDFLSGCSFTADVLSISVSGFIWAVTTMGFFKIPRQEIGDQRSLNVLFSW